jgi:hypothetical protein
VRKRRKGGKKNRERGELIERDGEKEKIKGKRVKVIRVKERNKIKA